MFLIQVPPQPSTPLTGLRLFMTGLQQNRNLDSWIREYGHSVAVTLVLLVGLGPPMVAQELPAGSVIEVSGVPTCQTCEIQFSHVVRLGSTDGKDAIWTPPYNVIRIGTDYILVSETDDGRLLLYDTAGNILDVFDRKGGGPEEVEDLATIARLGSTTVAILDWGNSRFSIIEAGSGKIEVVRTVRITDKLPGKIWSYDESNLIGYDEYAGWKEGTREAALQIYHLDESEARISASFDVVSTRVLPDVQRQRTVWADESHVWSSSLGEYLIRRWGLDGTPDGAFRFRPEWFSGKVEGALGPPSRPPDPLVNSLWTDDDGQLWVFTWRPSNAYKQAWEGLSELIRNGELMGSGRPAYHKMWNTNIDVIDPETGELVTSRMWISLVGGVLGDGFIWTQWQDEFGVPRVDIWRISMVTGERTGRRMP